MESVKHDEVAGESVASEESSTVPAEDGAGNGRKRKLSLTDDSNGAEPPNAKQQLLSEAEASSSDDNGTEDPETSSPEAPGVNLLDLSDEILLLIFQHLDGNSLLPLSYSCNRLQRLVGDKTLWIVADYTTTGLSSHEVQQRVWQLQPVTKTLKLRGLTSVYPEVRWNASTLTPVILETITLLCPLLERLELTEAYLDMNEISILMFPRTLRKLVLRKCAVSAQFPQENFLVPHPQISSFLSNIQHLVRLEELTIEYCAWFDTHDLMALSKLPNLRYLSLKGCVNIKDSVPYASLATRFGFKKLQVLDLRDTPISDSDVSCFNTVHSLRELLLECPEHLRTERGLHEYNEAERQRAEQLHRLAVPDIIHHNDGHPAQPAAAGEGGAAGEAAGGAGGPPPPLPPPRLGFEIRLINGDQDVVVHNYRNFARRSPPPARVYHVFADAEMNQPQAGQAGAQPPPPPPPPLAAVAAAAAAAAAEGAVPPPGLAAVAAAAAAAAAAEGAAPPAAPAADVQENNNNNNVNNNNNNNVDRQHIVRIINRDLLLQRPEQLELENPRRFLRRPLERQIHAAYQQIFNAGNNANLHRPWAPPDPPVRQERQPPAVVLAPVAQAPAPEAGPGAAAGADQAAAEPPPINLHLRINAVGHRRVINRIRHNPAPANGNGQPADPVQPPPPQPQAAGRPFQPQAHPPGPQRIVPHVIIMPGLDNIQDFIHRHGNGNHHQLFVNLGMGQQPANYVSLVSDRSICAYGVSRNDAVIGRLVPNLTGLERLSVRNYKLVTDISLEHLESAAPHLLLLDVTGTSVTASGVRGFRLSRPGCVVVCDFDDVLESSPKDNEQPPDAPPAQAQAPPEVPVP